MKKIKVLQWGVKHIATNHRSEFNTDYEEYHSMSIWDDGVPTLADARMMCEDLGIDRSDCYCDSSWGIIVIDLDGWLQEHGQEEYVPTGMEMWKRYGVEIGSPIEGTPKNDANGNELVAVSDCSSTEETDIYKIFPL